MRFASPLWLAGAAFALVVAAMFVFGGLRLVRATRRFGEPERVKELVTGQPARRRAWKGVLVVLATALAFFALARPEYGRGTRLIPATNLDVVVVLDYSKSMYARDVVPSRIARAKAEVARLIRDLPGARFGAVAFAGEPIGFPLTSDGAAIAQFFRQLDPNDMPIGGTAIARALEKARELLARDPKSRDHSRVLLLVTDGEDLEGDPVGVAKAAAAEGTVVDVVQIGGRTPERIPEIGEDGRVVGFRRDDKGQPLTTALSAEGEAQLAEIARATGGQIIRSERGTTGIETIAHELKRKMTDELAERVETVYADVYVYPLGAAIVLLVLETFLAETARRARAKALARAAAASSTLVLLAFFAGGCGWEPSRPFDRKAPEVEKAIAALDAGDASSAAALLESYLQTGVCADAGLGTPDRVRDRPNASFDLGLTLFHLGEQYGRRFGDEEIARDGGPTDEEQQAAALRSDQVECALRVVLAIADDPATPIELRARARYLAGNLELLRRQYEAAVKQYDGALGLVPGMIDGGDAIGRDAAWNRAIALERIEDEKKRDAGKDADDEPDARDAGDEKDAKDEPDAPDAQPDAPPDAGHDASEDRNEQPDGSDGGGGDDGGEDGGSDGGGQDAGAPPPSGEPPKQPSANEDERMLDMLEAAPTFQQQDAKNKAGARKVRRGMVDK